MARRLKKACSGGAASGFDIYADLETGANGRRAWGGGGLTPLPDRKGKSAGARELEG